MTLAEYLKQKREEQGILASQLADKAGLTRSHISEIERGKIALPNADIRRRLAAALGVSHLDLLVAAGEITEAELGTSVGLVERDDQDPRELLIDRIRELPWHEGTEGALAMAVELLEQRERGRKPK